MKRKQWYLIQYDIADAVRLRRVHRLLKSCALAVQNSVFAWHGYATELTQLQDRLQQMINPKADDIRGYRIRNPLLLIGQSPFIQDAYFSCLPAHQHGPLDWLAEHPPEFFQQP